MEIPRSSLQYQLLGVPCNIHVHNIHILLKKYNFIKNILIFKIFENTEKKSKIIKKIVKMTTKLSKNIFFLIFQENLWKAKNSQKNPKTTPIDHQNVQIDPKIKISKKISKSKFYENLSWNQNFMKIWPKVKIFLKFDSNSKFWEKLTRNQHLVKIWLKINIS